jgi:signal transduction histidine kinase/ActR/RegA family two-component response regulator
MMKGFRNQPIGRKALVLGLVPTACAIALVVILSTLATYLQARGSQTQDIETDAAIVAENVAAALAFNDKNAADDTVDAFRAKNNIASVCVFDAAGDLFASFVQGSGACPANRQERTEGILVVERPVMVAAREMGAVRVVGNFGRLYTWMQRQLAVAAGTLLAGILLSVLLTQWLGRAIVDPVRNLSAAAEHVSTTGDYAARASRMTDDELGQLADSFNGMLDQIQRQHDSMAELLEREQESSRLKDQFLAAVSHELRTPLNAILGWVQIIRTTRPGAQTVERALDSLERNARAQARLIEDLIETSRAVTGKLQLKIEVVDLRAVVKGALEVVNPAMVAKGMHVSTALPSSAALVSGDPDRLQQVAWNLLSNAQKFTPPNGSVRIELRPDGSDFVLTVADTGIGISPEFLPFVFDRFRQADGSMTREQGGLGLGLAIVKDIIELHGGSVTGASPGRNEGATFTVRVPQLVNAERSADLPETLPPTVRPSPSLAGVRTLAVDDDRDALEILSHALCAAGADVSSAASGEEAIALGTGRPFDVLVCDLAMPQVDGFAVLRALREQSAAFRNGAYAIALTAHASPEDRDRALEAGFDLHLPKPYEQRELIDAIARARVGKIL